MQCYWEQIGVLGPTYRLLGCGWSNQEIAKHLGRTEEMVGECVDWMLRFLKIRTRGELVFAAECARLNNRSATGVQLLEWSTQP